jgi:hypothetical protein
LTKLAISNSVSLIESCTFQNCSGLKSVAIPDKVKIIYSSAFNGCSGLTEVTVGNSVTEIYSGAFAGCPDILSVVALNATPPKTSSFSGVFDDGVYLNATLYVPANSISDYQNAAVWKKFQAIKSFDESNGVNDVYAEDDTTFSVCDGALHVSGDALVRVVALNGSIVYSGSGNQDINLDKGMYIVVIGNKARKIVVK